MSRCWEGIMTSWDDRWAHETALKKHDGDAAEIQKDEWGYDTITDTFGTHRQVRDGFKEFKKRIADHFPKRARQKPVLCPVTGEETWDRWGLSDRAWRLIQDGLKWQAQQQRVEEGKEIRRPYLVSSWWLNADTLPRPGGDTQHFSSVFSVTDLMFLMVHQRRTEVNLAQALADGVPWLHEERQRAYDGKVLKYQLTDEEAQMLRGFASKLMFSINQQHEMALNTGASWLQGMATGNVGVDQLNRLAAHQAAVEKGKDRGS